MENHWNHFAVVFFFSKLGCLVTIKMLSRKGGGFTTVVVLIHPLPHVSSMVGLHILGIPVFLGQEGSERTRDKYFSTCILECFKVLISCLQVPMR